MTKTQAIYDFFNSFGIKAYPTTAVPDKVALPYITYELSLGEWGDATTPAVNVYFHTTSENVIQRKVDEIAERIGLGGTQIAYDKGTIWITKGSPWCNAIAYQGDNTLKRRQLNVVMNFM